MALTLKIRRIAAIVFSLFHLYTSLFGILPGMRQRVIHLGFVLILIFLGGIADPKNKVWRKLLDAFFLVFGTLSVLYMYLFEEQISIRAGIVTNIDVVLGVIFILALLEATRRMFGPPLPIVCLCFLIYAYLGPYFPGILSHKGFNTTRIISVVFLTTEGVWGSILGVSATVIIVFILFGAFLMQTGIGQFITDFSYAVFGRVRGGPAKVSIVASSLFGSISGSAVANVVGTGTFTIPLMKRTGFAPAFAGAVEAVSSSGGQFMPPVMASVGFLIADVLGMPYGEVALRAFVPAILYYLAVFIMVDLRAAKTGLVGLKKEDLPPAKALLLSKGYLLLPLFLLLYLLVVVKYTAAMAGIWSLAATVLISMVRKETRLNVKKLLNALEEGAYGALSVAAACAAIGIIIGVTMLTGLGFRLSGAILALSGGHLSLLLFLTMVAAIILGMGVPTPAVYMMLSITIAPAITSMGVLPIAAHLFLLYYGVLANITPPVAVAAYAASGISGADPMRTGVAALKLGIAGFIVPFMFVYNNTIIGIGTVPSVIFNIILALILITGVAISIEGYLLAKMTVLERIAAMLGSVLILGIWGQYMICLGVCLLCAVVFYQVFKYRKRDTTIFS